MDSVFENLKELGSAEATQALSLRLGTEEQGTRRAMAAALVASLNARARRAADPEGAMALRAHLERSPPVGSIDGLLEHLAGPRRVAIEDRIGRRAGLDPTCVRPIPAARALPVLETLDRIRHERSWTASDLGRVLGAERARVEDEVPGSTGVFEELSTGWMAIWVKTSPRSGCRS